MDREVAKSAKEDAKIFKPRMEIRYTRMKFRIEVLICVNPIFIRG